MKNTFGNSATLTIFGESHGEAIGGVIDGLTPGLVVDEELIKMRLTQRRPKDLLSTQRREADNYKIVSGVFNGKTTGTPLCFMIENTNTQSKDYSDIEFLARPSHADYAANEKYHGYQDKRGGGHFSGRLTAVICFAGALVEGALLSKGIKVSSHISEIKGVHDDLFSTIPTNEELDAMNKDFPTISDKVASKMKEVILYARENLDSVGGKIECVVSGLNRGVGEPFFDSIESQISHAIFSIPAVKAIEFGLGTSFSDSSASEVNDIFCIKDGKVETLTNNNGGINGGISNGMPINFFATIKPTPSISRKQNTVDYKNMTETEIEIKGRHDPCIVQRAVYVVNALTEFVVYDMLVSKYGVDYFGDNK